MGPLYRPLEVGAALFPMSTLSKSSESGSFREGPNGSDVANGLSAFGLPSISSCALASKRHFLTGFRRLHYTKRIHGTRCDLNDPY